VLASMDIPGFGLARRTKIAGGLFLGVLAVSLLLYFLVGNAKVTRVLFYPHQGSKELVSESRDLPAHHDLEEDIRALVEEEILGPVSHDAALLFPRDVEVQSILVRGRTLFIDFSGQLALAGDRLNLRGAEAISALRRAITFNFPRIAELTVTIEGQVPRFGP
jgi:hypothetical protein